jgi:hypothetical protein
MVQLILPVSIYMSISELEGGDFEGHVLVQELHQRAGRCRNEHYPPELCPNNLLRLGIQ